MPAPSSLHRGVAAAVIVSLAAFGAIAVPSAASATPTGVVAAGDDWSVTAVPGGYRVTLRLEQRLPLVSDAPTLIADGEVIGLATESADGLSLSVTTADPSVADAERIEKGWASGSGDKAAEQDAGGSDDVGRRDPAPDDTPAIPTTDDPAAGGAFAVTEAEYDFGDQAIPLAGIGGIRGEMTGTLYLTDAPGARPTVVLLHGRHAACGSLDEDAEVTGDWPCAPGELNVRSYLGYAGTGRALAAHGYNVVSVAANAVNANDNQRALDFGAVARGRLVLDTLSMLRAASAGQPVAFDDVTPATGSEVASTVTRTLDDAFQYATSRTDQPATPSGLTAADLVGRFDLTRVGLMGHSRGGEGVVAAALLNQGEGEPFGIVSVLPLAPTDFARRTLPDAVTAVVLPYCDGDVSDQQGQHYIDDSRHAFGDDVQRSAVWVMGANHNFFSSVWTPGEYPVATGDDWYEFGESSCSADDPSRLTAPEQYQVGVSLMTGFFRATLGGETQFQPLFDGSVVSPTTAATGFADVRLMASAPTSSTSLVSDFSVTDGMQTAGGGVVRTCTGANTSAGMVDAPCSVYRDSSQVPHWSPGLFAPGVPTLTAGVFTWPDAGPDDAETPVLSIPVADAARDVSGRSQLSVKVAPEENSPGPVTDVAITVRDGSGGAFTRTATELNAAAVVPMPGGSMLLDKLVLQQLTIPTAEMTGVDLTDVTAIEFRPVSEGPVPAGGVYLSDLAFESPSAGSAAVPARAAVGMTQTRIDEGDGQSTAHVAISLDHAVGVPVAAYANVLVSEGGAVDAVSERVVFAPGQTCLTVPVQITGDDTASDEPSAQYTLAATTTGTGVMGADAFAQLIVREDDGGESPAFGIQGDACAERAAAGVATPLQVDSTDLAVGGTVTVTATGFRAGEAVEIAVGGEVFAPEQADADGVVERTLPVPLSAGLGPQQIVAEGAGSQRLQAADVTVRAPTSVSLAVSGGAAVGQPVTLVATVTGADTTGTVSFTDGLGGVGAGGSLAATAVAGALLGSAPVVDGVATLVLPDGLGAGAHALVASFAQTGTALASSSSPLELTVAAAGGSGGTGAPGGSEGSLAVTGGAGIAGWVVLAAALLVSAGALARVARRSRRGTSD